MANNRHNNYNNNIRYNNRIRLINSYMMHIETMNREFSNIINLYRNSEQNLSRLIFDEFNENDDNEDLDEESIGEEENVLNRSSSSVFLTPIRNIDYFNFSNRNTGRNININNNRIPQVNIETNNVSNTNNNSITNNTNNQNNSENNNILINDDFTNFMNPVTIRPSLEQINLSTVTSSYDLIENPVNTCCPISTVEFRSDDIVTKILYCGHIFLKIELENWFRSNVRCPLCRYDIRNYRSNTQNLI